MTDEEYLNFLIKKGLFSTGEANPFDFGDDAIDQDEEDYQEWATTDGGYAYQDDRDDGV